MDVFYDTINGIIIRVILSTEPTRTAEELGLDGSDFDEWSTTDDSALKTDIEINGEVWAVDNISTPTAYSEVPAKTQPAFVDPSDDPSNVWASGTIGIVEKDVGSEAELQTFLVEGLNPLSTTIEFVIYNSNWGGAYILTCTRGTDNDDYVWNTLENFLYIKFLLGNDASLGTYEIKSTVDYYHAELRRRFLFVGQNTAEVPIFNGKNWDFNFDFDFEIDFPTP